MLFDKFHTPTRGNPRSTHPLPGDSHPLFGPRRGSDYCWVPSSYQVVQALGWLISQCDSCSTVISACDGKMGYSLDPGVEPQPPATPPAAVTHIRELPLPPGISSDDSTLIATVASKDAWLLQNLVADAEYRITHHHRDRDLIAKLVTCERAISAANEDLAQTSLCVTAERLFRYRKLREEVTAVRNCARQQHLTHLHEYTHRRTADKHHITASRSKRHWDDLLKVYDCIKSGLDKNPHDPNWRQLFARVRLISACGLALRVLNADTSNHLSDVKSDVLRVKTACAWITHAIDHEPNQFKKDPWAISLNKAIHLLILPGCSLDAGQTHTEVRP